MPIAPEFRHLYGREWREVTRPRILKRAGNKCEQCGVPNQTDVTRVRGCWLEEKVSWRERIQKRWRSEDGMLLLEAPKGPTRRIRVILSIAHLNHKPGEDTDENLRAFCQYHHLAHDRGKHKQTRATRKDQARPLLTGMAEHTLGTAAMLKEFLTRGQRAQKAVDTIIEEHHKGATAK